MNSSFQGAEIKMLYPLMHEAVSIERTAGTPFFYWRKSCF